MVEFGVYSTVGASEEGYYSLAEFRRKVRQGWGGDLWQRMVNRRKTAWKDVVKIVEAC